MTESKQLDELVKLVDFNQMGIYTQMTPVSLAFRDVYVEVKNWASLCLGIMRELYKRYPDVVEAMRKKRGSIRVVRGHDTVKMINPKRIADDLYVETCYGADDLVARMREALVACQIDLGEVLIRYCLAKDRAAVIALLKGDGEADVSLPGTPPCMGSTGGVRDRFGEDWLAAAGQILRETGRPMHCREISDRALASGLLQQTVLPADVLMGSMLERAVSRAETLGELARFERLSPGIFALVDVQQEIFDQVADHNQRVRVALKEWLHLADEGEFIATITRLVVAMGIDPEAVTMREHGTLSIAGRFHVGTVVCSRVTLWVKRWKQPVSVARLREIRGVVGADERAFIISTGSICQGARDDASALGATPVALIDGDELVDLLIAHKIGVVRQDCVTVLGVPKLVTLETKI